MWFKNNKLRQLSKYFSISHYFKYTSIYVSQKKNFVSAVPHSPPQKKHAGFFGSPRPFVTACASPRIPSSFRTSCPALSRRSRAWKEDDLSEGSVACRGQPKKTGYIPLKLGPRPSPKGNGMARNQIPTHPFFRVRKMEKFQGGQRTLKTTQIHLLWGWGFVVWCCYDSQSCNWRWVGMGSLQSSFRIVFSCAFKRMGDLLKGKQTTMTTDKYWQKDKAFEKVVCFQDSSCWIIVDSWYIVCCMNNLNMKFSRELSYTPILLDISWNMSHTTKPKQSNKWNKIIPFLVGLNWLFFPNKNTISSQVSHVHRHSSHHPSRLCHHPTPRGMTGTNRVILEWNSEKMWMYREYIWYMISYI